MKMFISIFLLGLISGCATHAPYDYSAFKAAAPRSILILPPNNQSPDVNAPNAVLAQMSKPIAEAGYYVIPVTLMAASFQENGVYNGADAQSITPKKLREIFAADAALYTDITEYGNSYHLISAETAVSLRSRLVDLRTGITLWEGSARASSSEQNNNSGGGLAGLLIQAAVQQVVNQLADNGYTYAGVASFRLLSPRPNGLLYGPRSPKYQTGK
jgi:hypothetical protein